MDEKNCSSGSGSRKKFRIQEKVRDPNLERSSRSGSNLNYFKKIKKMPYTGTFFFFLPIKKKHQPTVKEHSTVQVPIFCSIIANRTFVGGAGKSSLYCRVGRKLSVVLHPNKNLRHCLPYIFYRSVLNLYLNLNAFCIPYRTQVFINKIIKQKCYPFNFLKF